VIAPPAASRPRRLASAGIGVAAGALAIGVVINPRLSWFALAGLMAGLGAAWLIAAVRHRQWRRSAIRLLVIIVAAVVFLSFFLSSLIRGPVRSLWSVPISATMEYRSDKHAFEITDTIRLTDEASTGICVADQLRSGQKEPSGGDAAGVDCESGVARNSYVRTAVENAGWTYKDDYNGHPRFTRSRQVAVQVPRWWPLSVTRSVDAPKVELDSSWLVADQDSTMTIVGPMHFIIHTVPPASSTEPTLDGAGSEQTNVPISYHETGGWDSIVRLELTSSVARNAVVAPLVDFSWWAPVKWIVLLVAGVFVAVFSDQLKDLIRGLFERLARRAGSRKKPDVKSPDTGQAAEAGLTDNRKDGPPADPAPAVGDPPAPPAVGDTVSDITVNPDENSDQTQLDDSRTHPQPATDNRLRR
jgi:hypothetical protein